MHSLDVYRKIHMYLPDDYLFSNKRYPVLYMFDGHNLFYDEDATYGRSWRLSESIERYGKEMIVVGQECSHEGNERLDEYSPYPFMIQLLVHFTEKGSRPWSFLCTTSNHILTPIFRPLPDVKIHGSADRAAAD